MPDTRREAIFEAIEHLSVLQAAIKRDLEPNIREAHAEINVGQTWNLLEQTKNALREKIKEEIKPEVVTAALQNTEKILTILGRLNDVLTQKSVAVRKEIDTFLSEKRELNVIKTLLQEVNAGKEVNAGNKYSEVINKLGSKRSELSNYIFELDKLQRIITRLEEEVVNETEEEMGEITKINHEANALVKIKDHELKEVENALLNTNSTDSNISRKIAEIIDSIDKLHQEIDLEKVTQRRDARNQNWRVIKEYKHINSVNTELERNLKAIETICAKGIKGESTQGLDMNIKGALSEIEKEIKSQKRVIDALENIRDSVTPAIVQETQQITTAAQELKTNLTQLQGLLPQTN